MAKPTDQQMQAANAAAGVQAARNAASQIFGSSGGQATIGSTKTTGPGGYTTQYNNGAGATFTVRDRGPSSGTGASVSVLGQTPDAAQDTGTNDNGLFNNAENDNNTRHHWNYASGGGSSGGYAGGGGASYSAPTLPTATDQSEYIRSMYDANERAARENLRAEYENNIAALDRAQGRLPDTYNAAVDQANTQAAINRANFNEAAAANGLNTGAGSQVRLSQNNALQGNVASIRKAQADAQSDLDFQRTQLEAQYQQAIRKAIADNDMQRAQALYQEARRVDESIVNTAVNQANLNWNVWRALYG